MKTTITWLGALAGLGLLVGCNRAPQTGSGKFPPPQVTVRPAEQREIVEWEEFTGRVEALETVELRPRVSGYIMETRFKSGESVKKDDVLFLIDPRIYAARVAQMESELLRATAAAEMAQKEFDRVAELLAAKALSPEQGETRLMNQRQTAAMVEAAKATLVAAKLDLEFTEVRAPISGRVSRALITPGNYVSGQAGSASLLTTIVSTDPVFVYADLDENTLLRVQQLARDKKLVTDAEGRVPAELQLSNETSFPHKGHLESFDNRVDAGTGSIVVRAVFANPQEQLTPGFFARLRLPVSGKYPAVLVEDRAILTDQARKYVLTVAANNISKAQPVTLGPLVDGLRVIRDGLAAGDQVIVNGHARVQQPGTPVHPVAETSAPAPVANR